MATFTSHNIRLDSGAYTKPDEGVTMGTHHVFLSAKRVLDAIFPGDKSAYRLADLGCLEGGYAVEFARMGFQVLGIEVRESNFAACSYVKANTSLPNLKFVRDDAWNIAKHGTFDVMFCCGLFYHLDRPRKFLRLLADVTSKALILNTHFSVRRFLRPLSEHEGLKGRWFREFGSDAEFAERDSMRWASWDNRRSFWIQREYLLDAIKDAGFATVLEQFDHLGAIAPSILGGDYQKHCRGSFIGIKS